MIHWLLLVVFVWGVWDLFSGMGIMLRVLLVPLAWALGLSRRPRYGYTPEQLAAIRAGRRPPRVDPYGIPFLE